MISSGDFYTVMAAMVPLYVAMFLAYGSVRWWEIFTPVQCSGINRFVAVFAVPLLSFNFISTNNPYKMDGPFILADTIAKVVIFCILLAWARFSRNGSLDWLITIFSLATLPNTLVMGIPLLEAMYGNFYGGLMVQLVVLQCIIWYTLLLFLFEYRAARLLVMEQFPDTAPSIISFKVDSDVASLDGREPLQTLADVDEDGKIRVTIRRSTSSRSQASNSFASPRRSLGLASMPSSKAITPRPSNLSRSDFGHGDLQSLISTRTISPRNSNLTASDAYSVHSSRGPTPRASNVNEDNYKEICAPGRGLNSPRLPPPQFGLSALPLNTRMQGSNGGHERMQGGPGLNTASWSIYSGVSPGKISPSLAPKKSPQLRIPPKVGDDSKELHMFVWSSTASPVSEGGLNVVGANDVGGAEKNKPANEHKEVRMLVSPADQTPNRGTATEPSIPQAISPGPIGEDFSFCCRAKFPGDVDSPIDKQSRSVSKFPKNADLGKAKGLPPTTVMLKLILQMVGRKLLRNPNTYSSLLGLIWSLIAFKWNIALPKIISGSIKILSNAGLGMAMFSLGLFMALQPRLIACGTSLAACAMAIRFLTGPAVMAASSIAVGLRKIDLRAAIVQAALPQGIVPFVFAREYDLHPDILSTAVIFGMLIALPITLLYYILLGL